MAYAHFERLSALDLSLLAMEDGRAHMHIGSVSIFDARPLRRGDGTLDFERILACLESQLQKVPRLRQKLAWVPGFAQPVWVDDERFNVLFHVRYTALPPPGDARQLKRMTGRVMSQELDRGKPLWEDWFVDGLEGNRFALVSKLHHCMADGVSGVTIANLLVGSDPDWEPAPPTSWIPRPAPSATQLVLEELKHRASAPLQLLRRARSGSSQPVRGTPGSGGLRKLIESAASLVSGASETPLNVEVGPHRRFDWTRLPFAEVHAIGANAGGHVNDVALAIASGALAKLLHRRGVSVDDLDFRAAVPVSLRTPSERKSLGNRVSGMLVSLPLSETDPWRRLLRVIETTQELKGSGQSAAGEMFTQGMDLLPPRLMGPIFRGAARSSAANTVITNVPGVRNPLYLLGARQLETYPVVPLAWNQALGIALLSYDEGLFWGFNSDWDALPDLHELVLDVESGFEELRDAAPLAREAASPVAEAGA